MVSSSDSEAVALPEEARNRWEPSCYSVTQRGPFESAVAELVALGSDDSRSSRSLQVPEGSPEDPAGADLGSRSGPGPS
jgi:hypothetical protein